MANFHIDTGHKEDKPRLHLARHEIDIVNFNAISTPSYLCACYTVSFSHVFSKHHAYLDVLSLGKVLLPENGMTFALRNGDIEAALFYERAFSEQGLSLTFKGLIGMGRVPQLVAPIILASVKAEQQTNNAVISAKAVVRIMPDGRVNIGSSKSLMRAGFFPSQSRLVAIQKNNLHLTLTAEPCGTKFRFLMMEATPNDLFEASARVLNDWQEKE